MPDVQEFILNCRRFAFSLLPSIVIEARGVSRVTVATLNEQRQVVYQQTTGIKNLTLSKTEEVPLMIFDKDVTFPLIISANILFTSPEETTTSQASTQTTQ